MSNERNYYAVSYHNGVASCARTGKRYLASYHSFPTPKERDEWCEGGGEYRTSNFWREPILSSDCELRSVLYENGTEDPYRDYVINH